MNRDSKGRFVSKSAEKVECSEQKEIERKTIENPSELCDDAEPMQFETPEGGPTPEDEGTGCAVAASLIIVAAISAIALWFLSQSFNA